MLVDLLLPERIEVIPFEDPRVLALDSLHDLRGQAVDVAHLDHVEQIRAAEQLEVALDGLGQVSGDPEDPPPTLALLAVMSLAAENMREGDGKAANNFYGRLAELLSLDDKQREDFIAAYRKVRGGRAMSDVLWGSLSLWLELLEGNRGLVTVFAERNVHVSLPMSQALVREVDRDKFRTTFGLYGLAPRSTLPAAEMVEVIDDWMSHDPCPASNQSTRALAGPNAWGRLGGLRSMSDLGRFTHIVRSSLWALRR